jgi:ABC-type uncharacterized transport system substrate-binding protein
MAMLVESFSKLTSQVKSLAADGPLPGAYNGMSAEDLTQLLQNTQKQIQGTDPRAIPAGLSTTITTLTQKIRSLQDRLLTLTDMHHNEKLAETFNTPGSPLVGFPPTHTTGAQADTMLNIFKQTQKIRKISMEEIENSMPGLPDTKPGF